MIKICIDAGFLKTVEVGQYFMTQHTDEFSQYTEPATCREYTLPRDENSTEPKGWIRGNTKIGPVLEVTISYFQNKYGVEIRIESVNDKSQSWVRISHDLNKFATELIHKEYDDNEQEISETKTEAFVLRTKELAFASRKQNHEHVLLHAHLQALYLYLKNFGLMLSQDHVRMSLSQYQKDMDNYLEKKDGTIEFWRLKRLFSERI